MWQLKPLKHAEIYAPLGIVFYLADMRFLARGNVYIWILESEDEKILIDSGVEEPKNGFVKRFPVVGGGERIFREILLKAGVKVEEVEKLILTHLHIDHVAFASLFHNARIYVQRSEWRSAFDPLPHYREAYDERLFAPLEKMDLCLVDGDVCIAEGVKLIHLPGHTEGLQGVLFEGKREKYLFAGDHFYSYFNIFPPVQPIELRNSKGETAVLSGENLPFIPPGLNINLGDWFKSSFKVLSIVRRRNIIPGHDLAIEGKIIS
ncbi:MAG: MBL fold metallo-hydrolase [Archaeoglobaceae archaeon]|nr:MBL fold metallo-hydrolase [Archaeoglobaceae archaeon]MCX8152099.1 MBL fold metallo-hydrolase [Archaeoglobaceae archaeon]MDW8013534.1 MBL fold metallo-hydrolase [Archaeoglobaceae archaeon]